MPYGAEILLLNIKPKKKAKPHSICITKDLYKDIHSGTVDNSKNLEITQMSTNKFCDIIQKILCNSQKKFKTNR